MSLKTFGRKTCRCSAGALFENSFDPVSYFPSIHGGESLRKNVGLSMQFWLVPGVKICFLNKNIKNKNKKQVPITPHRENIFQLQLEFWLVDIFSTV